MKLYINWYVAELKIDASEKNFGNFKLIMLMIYAL